MKGREPPGDGRTKGQLLKDSLDGLRPFRGIPLYIGDHLDDRAASLACAVEFVKYGPATWDRILELVLEDVPPAAVSPGEPQLRHPRGET